MPVLKSNNFTSKKLYLPSTSHLAVEDQAFIVAQVGPIMTGDIVNSAFQELTPTQQSVHLLVGRVKEWNFTDENGQPVEINYDNVCKLDVGDFGYIVNTIIEQTDNALTTSEKKA